MLKNLSLTLTLTASLAVFTAALGTTTQTLAMDDQESHIVTRIPKELTTKILTLSDLDIGSSKTFFINSKYRLVCKYWKQSIDQYTRENMNTIFNKGNIYTNWDNNFYYTTSWKFADSRLTNDQEKNNKQIAIQGSINTSDTLLLRVIGTAKDSKSPALQKFIGLLYHGGPTSTAAIEINLEWLNK